MKQYSEQEIKLLNQVNTIGNQMGPSPDDDLIFITLGPYLDSLMLFLKKLNASQMQTVFLKYPGVMKVMRMIEDCAKAMEKSMGIKPC